MDSHTWGHPRCHVCPHSREWTHCMERTVVCLYIKSFITNQYLHDPKGLGLHCRVITNPTQETLVFNVFSQPACATIELSTIGKIHKYRRLHEVPTLFWWPWRCTTHLGMILIISSRNVPIYSIIDYQEAIYPCIFAFNFSSNVLILLFNVF
jgi:hypothetical protein